MNETKPVFIVQTRKGIFKDNGTVLYSITTEVKMNTYYTGDSRDSEYLLNLFVNKIVNEENPLEDSFSHYATIADLDLIPTDRDSAVNRGLVNYRDNVNRVSFDNLSVATTASKVIRDTLNNIVETYLRVKNEFVGSDTHYFPYPQEITSLRDQFISSYKAAKDARLSAEEAQDLAQQEYNTAQAISDIREECKQKICSIYEKLTGMNTLVQTIGSKYIDTLSTIIDGSAANSEDLEDEASQAVLQTLKSYIQSNSVKLGLIFDTAFTSEIDSSGNGLTLLAGITQLTTQSMNDCSVAEGNAIIAANTVNSSLSDLKTKQELKESASQAEEAALAELTIYCPNLDPASI